MATPTFVSVGTAATSTGAALSVPWGTSHAVNDVGILVIESSGNATPQGAIAGWTEIPLSPQIDVATTAGSIIQAFWKKATSTAEANVATAVRTDHQLARIYVFRGCGTPPIWAAAAAVTSVTTSTASAPAVVTPVPNSLSVAIISRPSDSAAVNHFSAQANADLTSVTARGEAGTVDGNGGGFGVFTGIKATAGPIQAWTATKGTSSTQAAIHIVLSDAVALANAYWGIRSH